MKFDFGEDTLDEGDNGFAGDGLGDEDPRRYA